ncbi:hypothetical protein D3C85_1818940 [compost metagenome]
MLDHQFYRIGRFNGAVAYADRYNGFGFNPFANIFRHLIRFAALCPDAGKQLFAAVASGMAQT